jgi:regulator of sirC expression with transglutaminase-like and TPR domain
MIGRCGRGWITCVVVLLLAAPALADDRHASLRALFAMDEREIDYATAKRIVDRMIDPGTDEAEARRQLDHWERAIRANIPANATPGQRFAALVDTLYQPGPWNDGRPFTYDLDDPMGTVPANKRLATYLATRKGNCISMPILVLILGQRLGLPLAMATAPRHVFVKVHDAGEQAWRSFEATAGGFKRDSSYVRETHIAPLAIENAIYLRPLSPREGLGVIAGTLMEHHAARGDGDALMEVADLALAANPRDASAMLWKANAYVLQIQSRYVRKYPDANDIPPKLREDYFRLSRENLAWFEKAEQLGWTPQTPEQEAEYLRSIERERGKRSTQWDPRRSRR